MTTQANARPGANGTGIKQVGETTLSVPPGWHEQAEHEGRWWYAEGYRDGYAAAERAIADEIRAAVGIEPMDPHKVIRWLIAGVGVARKGATP
ncbi:hypothetical protein [Micromonospora globbae]|uniref:hypothetical protein n=1 Tax=Micromonospora globbae TaxID=1894969 RepID=UPI00342E5A3B